MTSRPTERAVTWGDWLCALTDAQREAVRLCWVEGYTMREAGERDENMARKDFTPSEAVAIWQAMESYQGQRDNLCANCAEVPRRERAAQALEPVERAAARERMRSHTAAGYEKVTDPAPALDRVAATVGMSRPTLARAREVVEAAERAKNGAAILNKRPFFPYVGMRANDIHLRGMRADFANRA